MSNRFIAWVLAAVVLIVGGIILWSGKAHAPVESTPASETVTASSFTFEIVESPEARAKGLGGRTNIPEEYGMFFIFPKKDLYGFWMKDMHTSIDIIWLNDDGTILAIDANVSPATYPDSYFPPEPVRYVLETRAGEAARKGWNAGTKLDLPL